MMKSSANDDDFTLDVLNLTVIAVLILISQFVAVFLLYKNY